MQSDRSDRELYIKDYHNLIDSYEIHINSKYQFVYDDFMTHLITDALNNIKYNKTDQQKVVNFRSIFYRHLISKEWYNKLMTPEECPETIKRLRKYKLEKINENYGN